MKRFAILAALLIWRMPALAAHALGWDHGVVQGEQKETSDYQYLIYNEKDWKFYWSKRVGIDSSQTPPPIDFSSEFALAISPGETPEPGYQVEISTKTDPRDPQHLVVYYWYAAPAKGESSAGKAKRPYLVKKFSLRAYKEFELVYNEGLDPVDREAGLDLPAVRPTAEVTATKGPIQLTLRLYKKIVKLDTPLWYQISIKNVGKGKVGVVDKIFWDPTKVDGFIYPEVIGPDGKAIKQQEFRPRGNDTHWEEDGHETLGVDQGNQLNDLRDQWKKQGLSQDQIDSKSADYIRDAQEAKSSTSLHGSSPYLLLLPGGSITTPAWAYWDGRTTPRPKQIGAFAELMGVHLYPAGKYRVRAVYHEAPSQFLLKYKKKIGESTTPDEIDVETGFIEVTVAP